MYIFHQYRIYITSKTRNAITLFYWWLVNPPLQKVFTFLKSVIKTIYRFKIKSRTSPDKFEEK